MKLGVFVCGLIVALAQYSSADQICGYPIAYTTAFVPTCYGNEAVMKWPYYQDFTKYYDCFQGVPILMNCSENTYFTYVNQQCLGCDRFRPSPECQNLKTINPPQCVPMGTTPTPATTPTTTPKATTIKTTPTTATPKTTPTTTSSTTTTTTTTAKPETVPTPGSGGDIPTPPLIPTSAPGIPTPPVEPPTPPTVEETPQLRP